MLKVFTGFVFIAQIVILLTLVNKIIKLDRWVNKFNANLDKKRYIIESALLDFQALYKDALALAKAKSEKLKAKQKEYSLEAVKIIVFYLGLFFLKGRYRKLFILYECLSDVIRGIWAGLKYKI